MGGGSRSRVSRNATRRPYVKPGGGSHFLVTVELLDCNGRVNFTLRLELDGIVSVVVTAGRTARIDPVSRMNLTPTIRAPDAVIEQVCQLRPG